MSEFDKVLKLIKQENIKFVDLRFTDTRGKEQHVTVSAEVATQSFFEEGKFFDGSSIAGWRGIDESDMLLKPDPTTARIDPFYEEPTLNLTCDIYDPFTMKSYNRDPRSVAKRAVEYLKSTGIADTCNVGPEPEFFIFDDVRWKLDMCQASYKVDSQEAAWNSATEYDGGNMGHRPRIKGGYFPVPPIDSAHDLRGAMCLTLKDMGLIVETHHHEVATSNQNEIDIQYQSLVEMADSVQLFKYIVHNVAHVYGKTATFMPKPLVGDNGSGMHCHMSLAKNGVNLFAGKIYNGLSELALHFIGGIIKHARALNAFTNPTTNSYKRLVPGFEAPVVLGYSVRNRSAAIRIPIVFSDKARRVEIRFPDPMLNPYLAFSALMMAGLDGIRNKYHPGEAMDRDLYELSADELSKIPTVCASLEEALNSLDADYDFLLEGGVFDRDTLASFKALKQEEITRFRMTTHPVEFDMYYSG